MSLHDDMIAMGDRALTASREMVLLGSDARNDILLAMADALDAGKQELVEANRKDLDEGRKAGLSAALLDRLLLNDSRIAGMTRGLRTVAGLPDPVGARISRWIRPNGLEIVKLRVPIGVIVIIYESRPNVTADSAGLCFKTSNAVILRGGKEAMNSNLAIVDAMIAGGGRKGLPENAIQFITTTDRDAVRELVQLEGRVDLAIPRGGEALIRAVTEQARVPVIKHYKGVCHVYVDEIRRPGHGAEDRRERQVPAARRLQRHGNAAGPREDRRSLPARLRRTVHANWAWSCGATPPRARSCPR